MTRTPADLQKRLLEHGLCAPGELHACSEEDIELIEGHIGTPLPNEYKNVMRAIGRGCGQFMSDLEAFYPAVVSLTDRIRTLLADRIALPDGAFVFVNRDGDQVLFFYLNAGNDPPIYRWSSEEPTDFGKVFPSVWDFLEEEAQGYGSILETLRKARK